MNRFETLTRLNEEREYEDQLAHNLLDNICQLLYTMPGLQFEERAELLDKLSSIANDSLRHSAIFDMLAQMVFEGEENAEF